MQDRIFDQVLNPNNRALVVPQQDGGTEDDHYFGSIGDATQSHIMGLSIADRQLWEELICTKSGTIFRTVPTSNWDDPDLLGLRSKTERELKKYLDQYSNEIKKNLKRAPTESELAAVSEAILQEQERREASEDVIDRAQLIPYDNMKDNPGLTKHTDIPPAPKDVSVYMGNTTQIFYDSFPEGHVDADTINQILMRLNRETDDLTEDYGDWIKKWIIENAKKAYVAKYMNALVDTLVHTSCDPIEETEKALAAIDQCWHVEYMNEVAGRIGNDTLLQLLRAKRKEWKELAKQGQSAMPAIKQFGKILWQDYKDKMKSHHWHLYRQCKKEHAPRIMLHGIDLNRCGLEDLYRLVKMSRSTKASKYISAAIPRKIWTMRPFESIWHMRNLGLLPGALFAQESKSLSIIEQIDEASNKVRDTKSLNPLNLVRNQIFTAQQRGLMPEISNWTSIWQYYNVVKQELTKFLSKKEDK